MFTEQHLAQILRHASHARLQAFLQPLLSAMHAHGIDASLRRSAAFVAQLAHESGEFQFMEEIWGRRSATSRKARWPGGWAMWRRATAGASRAAGRSR